MSAQGSSRRNGRSRSPRRDHGSARQTSGLSGNRYRDRDRDRCGPSRALAPQPRGRGGPSSAIGSAPQGVDTSWATVRPTQSEDERDEREFLEMWETPSPNAEKTSPPAPNGDDTWMDLGGEELEQQEDEPTIQHCNAVLKISPPLPYGSGAPAAAKGDDAPIDLGGDELEQQEEDQIVQPPPKAASTSSKGKEKAVENTAHGSLALGEAGRTAIQDALEGAADDDEFASNVLSLLKAVIEAEKAAGMGPGEAGITIGRQKLYRDDVLSLYCLDGQEGAAWFREGIINALLTLEESHGPASVHIESDFALWFEDRYTAVLDRDIEKAEGDGSAPETGWPFIDLRDHHSRILASLNPSGVHWVAVEISIPLEEDAPMKLIYYNSMSRMTVEDPTFVAATQTLPKLLYLASLRPGSPLAGFNPHTLIVEEAQCPQQVGSWDCGPFSVYFLAKRLHNERIRRTSTNYFHQRDMGRRLRRACAKVLHMNHARDARTSLKEAFAETEPEPLEDEGDTDADLDAQIAALAAAAAADANSTTSGEADGQEGSLLIGTDLRPVIRFEIGAASRSVRTIILIIRWSSQPWFWRTYCLHVQAAGGTVDLGRFRTVVESLARERLAIYLEACGDVTAIEDLHIIVYAGTGIHTRFVPCSVDEAVEEAAEKAAEKAAKKATEKAAKKAAEANGFLQCPIKPCDKRWSKVKGKTLTRLLRHLWNHMPHPIQSVDSEGKITYRCPIGSCKFENSSKKPKDSVSAHISKTHAQVWLEEQMAKGLCIVPPELKELLEDGSESQCPYCGHSFTGTSAEDNLNYHMKRLHFREDNLPGWFTCEHVDEIDLGRSWDELQPGLQARLISSWGSECAYRTAGKECPGGAATREHYASQHGQSPWPFDIDEEMGICRARFQSPEALQAHETRIHRRIRMHNRTGVDERPRIHKPTRVHERTSVPRALRGPHGDIRAISWTLAITADLRAACQQQSETQPVLLSVGLDGFTCHTGHLLKWLQQVDLAFTFAIITDSIPTLDAQYFIQVGSAYISSYDSHLLRAALLVRSQAAANYADLFAYWEGLQAMKDTHSELGTVRNNMRTHLL